MLVYFAIIAAWVGEKDTALQYLAANVQSPGGHIIATYGALKLLPFWDPLRIADNLSKAGWSWG
jgi:hypothetical protein